MMYLCCDAIVGHQQITKIMKKVIAIIFTALLSLGSISAYGQKSYPADIFIYELDSVVTYKGKAPKITDFLEAFLAQDETSEVLWLLSQCWNHYLLGEPQDPCVQFTVDEKNGYIRYTFDSNLCGDYGDEDDYFYYEMCYWNCADGKHKIIAENVVSMSGGKYYLGQYCGTTFYIYDNATRKIYTAEDELLGAHIDLEDYKSSLEKGDEMTKYDETVVLYHLPQQGKDITVDIYKGSLKKTGIRLVWDGMRFKRQ